MSTRDRDLELLIPVGGISEINGGASKSSSPSSSPPAIVSTHHHTSQEAFTKVIRSWASKKFISGCVILFPMAITFYITWFFIKFVDGFFSPIYNHLGINIFGLGFLTSITFIFLVGIFMSSWLGASVLTLGEWFIKKMPLISYIYTASKQISSAISPDQTSNAFKEVAIIRHPRVGEYALGFITNSVILQRNADEEELCCVYVPSNHLYLGDIFLVNPKDVLRPNLSVREGIEIVISGGMSIPQILTTTGAKANLSRISSFSSSKACLTVDHLLNYMFHDYLTDLEKEKLLLLELNGKCQQRAPSDAVIFVRNESEPLILCYSVALKIRDIHQYKGLAYVSFSTSPQTPSSLPWRLFCY